MARFGRRSGIEARPKRQTLGVFIIDVANTLLAVAQIAVGLAGFSAILVALSGKPHQCTPVDAFRIRNILAFSFQSIFLALIPVVLSFFSLPESTVWRVSPLIIAIATFGDVLLVVSGVYRLSRSERAILKAGVVSSVVATLLAMAAVELFAAFKIIQGAVGVFFLGLVVLLGISTVLMARFLFARPAD